jgi:DNA-binding CsgD family transcriptional regulator
MLYPIRNEQSVAHRIQQLYGLTTRETEVLDWLIQGERYLNIAEHLYISLNTVKSHAKSIYLKTSTANRNELQDLTNALEKNTNKTN